MSADPNNFIKIPPSYMRALQTGFKERILDDMVNNERMTAMIHDHAYEICADVHELDENLTHFVVNRMFDSLYRWVEDSLKVTTREDRHDHLDVEEEYDK